MSAYSIVTEEARKKYEFLGAIAHASVASWIHNQWHLRDGGTERIMLAGISV